jgi:hypothetical protein
MNHQVQEGECLHTIADQYGFLWKTIWDHPDNRQLKSDRKSPESLQAGDIVSIPELRIRTEKCPTDHEYNFRLKNKPCFRMETIAEVGETPAFEAEIEIEAPLFLESDIEVLNE